MIADLVFEWKQRLRALSPRSRQWREFLRSLPLDPDRLPRPLEPLSDEDFIICGAPRTGTTLLSAALMQPPKIVTVMEPWDGMRVEPARLFAMLRSSIVGSGALSAGKLDLAALHDRGEVAWGREGSARYAIEVGDDFLLGVKWPAFWRYLPLLPDTKFLVTLRHPYEVVQSFRRQGGRLRLGLQYDTVFNQRMNEHLEAAEKDLAHRRVLLFDYIHERILPHLARPNVLVVRYERWFHDPEALLEEIGRFLGVGELSSNVAIRPPAPMRLSDRERALIRRECHTAKALGYSLA
jgi:hypothetical protein